MAPKKEKVPSGRRGRKMGKRMTVHLKKEIVAKHEKGVRVTDLAKYYGVAKSTISTIIKHKEAIKAADVAKGVTVISKQRSKVLEEVEKLLLVWINQKQLAGDSVSGTLICEMARLLHSDLLKQLPSANDEAETKDFKASRGWFEKFQRRTGIHSVIWHGEAASSNINAANEFVNEFGNLIESEDYVPPVFFNYSGTGLFCKKMPKRTFVTPEEEVLPEIISKSMGSEIDDSDSQESVDDHHEELTVELIDVQSELVKEEHSPAEDEVSEEVTLPSAVIKDMCSKWSELREFVKKNHPNKVVAKSAIDFFTDNAMSHFRKILQQRKRQKSLDRFSVHKADDKLGDETLKKVQKKNKSKVSPVSAEEDSFLQQ